MKYIIPKGKDFYCEFIIKEPGAGVPMDVGGMTGTFTLSEIGIAPCVVLITNIFVVDAENGLIAINLSAEETSLLESRSGFAEDCYPLIATYSASLDLLLDQPINVLIPKVYVLDSGENCTT